MVEIWLPYGSSEIPVRVPEETLVEILTGQVERTSYDPISELRRSLEAGDKFLSAAREARKICVAVGSSSNPEATEGIIKALVDKLTTENASQPSITVLRTSDAPMFDQNAFGNTKIVSHDSASRVVPLRNFEGHYVPTINQTLAEADLSIAVGELKPHHFLERCGLCDIVFPGLASPDSIQNHYSNRRAGAADLFKERVEIAKSISDLFAVGFVLDAKRCVLRIAFSSFDGALKELDEPLKAVCSVSPRRSADIVVLSAGGKPTDESLVRAVDTFPQGLAALKRDGALIVAAECPLGHGGTEFYDWCAERKEPRYLEARLKHSFNYNGSKAAFLTRTLETHRVYLVSTIPDHYVEGVFGLKAAATVNSALQAAQRALGSDSTVSVIPDASRITVTQPQTGRAT